MQFMSWKLWFGDMEIVVAGLAVVVAVVLILQNLAGKNNYLDGKKLPPGSMGLPLIGETLQFFIPSNSIDIVPFIKKRTRRYGKLFKTRLVGEPVVISTDPDFNHYILQQEGKLVELWYMSAFAKLTGHDDSTDLKVKTNTFGDVHHHLIKLVLSHIGGETIKEKLFPQIESMVERALNAWSAKESVEARLGCSTMLFSLASKLLFSFDLEGSHYSESEDLARDVCRIPDGILALPINLPGTTFNRSLKSQKKWMKIIEREISERLARPEDRKEDFLGHILREMKSREYLTVKFITYIVLTLLVATIETVSASLSMTLKLLTENSQVVEELTRENEEILRVRREAGEMGITWKEYRSMTYTMQVINESLRLSNAAPGIMRRATQDIHSNGFVIPKGWTILIPHSGVHLDPETFEDPLSFTPSRWKEENSVARKYYVPFGAGGRPCPGAAFSKAAMAIFLHVLVTKYRWRKVKGGEVVRNPALGFKNGLYLNFSKKMAAA